VVAFEVLTPSAFAETSYTRTKRCTEWDDKGKCKKSVTANDTVTMAEARSGDELQMPVTSIHPTQMFVGTANVFELVDDRTRKAFIKEFSDQYATSNAERQLASRAATSTNKTRAQLLEEGKVSFRRDWQSALADFAHQKFVQEQRTAFSKSAEEAEELWKKKVKAQMKKEGKRKDAAAKRKAEIALGEKYMSSYWHTDFPAFLRERDPHMHTSFMQLVGQNPGRYLLNYFREKELSKSYPIVISDAASGRQRMLTDGHHRALLTYLAQQQGGEPLNVAVVVTDNFSRDPERGKRQWNNYLAQMCEKNQLYFTPEIRNGLLRRTSELEAEHRELVASKKREIEDLKEELGRNEPGLVQAFMRAKGAANRANDVFKFSRDNHRRTPDELQRMQVDVRDKLAAVVRAKQALDAARNKVPTAEAELREMQDSHHAKLGSFIQEAFSARNPASGQPNIPESIDRVPTSSMRSIMGAFLPQNNNSDFNFDARNHRAGINNGLYKDYLEFYIGEKMMQAGIKFPRPEDVVLSMPRRNQFPEGTSGNRQYKNQLVKYNNVLKLMVKMKELMFGNQTDAAGSPYSSQFRSLFQSLAKDDKVNQAMTEFDQQRQLYQDGEHHNVRLTSTEETLMSKLWPNVCHPDGDCEPVAQGGPVDLRAVAALQGAADVKHQAAPARGFRIGRGRIPALGQAGKCLNPKGLTREQLDAEMDDVEAVAAAPAVAAEGEDPLDALSATDLENLARLGEQGYTPQNVDCN